MPELYTIDDVPAWMIDRGIGHIVAGQGLGSGWAQWACGTQLPYGNDDILKDVPKRICKKCRAELARHRSDFLKTQKV
tara:strand:+ start:23834 stop:24067 length:234 start_codon:yes stop_codon:yes gene_type:complete